eukprot:6365909-Heterocapsa_arctica.AAC.1
MPCMLMSFIYGISVRQPMHRVGLFLPYRYSPGQHQRGRAEHESGQEGHPQSADKVFRVRYVAGA